MEKEGRLIQFSVEEMASSVEPLLTKLSEYERRSLGSELWRRREQLENLKSD